MPRGIYKHRPTQGFQKGHIPLHKGKTLPKAQKKKMSESHNGLKPALGKHWKLSKETVKKMSGENSPHWLGGKSFEPYTIEWTKTLKRAIRERDHYTCQLCGKLQEDIAFCIHHIDYDKKNCNPNNLITLCKNCHTITNHNREYWVNYFNE